MGEGRGRIVRRLLTESVMLSVAGGVVGLAIGYVGIRVILRVSPGNKLLYSLTLSHPNHDGTEVTDRVHRITFARSQHFLPNLVIQPTVTTQDRQRFPPVSGQRLGFEL